MGICWSSEPDKSKSDPVPSIIDISAGDASFVGDNSWLTVASTYVTAWVSQVSDSFTSIWAKSNATEKAECSDASNNKDFSKGYVNIAGTNLKVFSYAQLEAATNNFRREMMVGKGGFGNVYKGWQKEKVPSMGIKKVISVKKLSAGSWQGVKQWRLCAFELQR